MFLSLHRISWAVTMLALFAYWLYEMIVNSNHQSFAILLLAMQNIAFFGTKLILTDRMSKDNADEE